MGGGIEHRGLGRNLVSEHKVCGGGVLCACRQNTQTDKRAVCTCAHNKKNCCVRAREKQFSAGGAAGGAAERPETKGELSAPPARARDNACSSISSFFVRVCVCGATRPHALSLSLRRQKPDKDEIIIIDRGGGGGAEVRGSSKAAEDSSLPSVLLLKRARKWAWAFKNARLCFSSRPQK